MSVTVPLVLHTKHCVAEMRCSTNKNTRQAKAARACVCVRYHTGSQPRRTLRHHHPARPHTQTHRDTCHNTQYNIVHKKLSPPYRYHDTKHRRFVCTRETETLQLRTANSRAKINLVRSCTMRALDWRSCRPKIDTTETGGWFHSGWCVCMLGARFQASLAAAPVTVFQGSDEMRTEKRAVGHEKKGIYSVYTKRLYSCCYCTVATHPVQLPTRVPHSKIHVLL